MQEQPPQRPNPPLTFQQKVWTVCGITALFVALLWFFMITFNVFLLILAGVLIALFFHGLAGLIQRKLHLPQKASLLVSVISTFIIIILASWFMGSTIQLQITELAKTLPSTVNNAKIQLASTFLGQKFLEKTSWDKVSDQAYGFFSKFFNSTFGVFTDAYIVLFLGLFFTAAPRTYLNGFLKLIPPKAKLEAKYTVERIGFTLTKWLKGQIFAMIAIALLKGIALTILGVPMAIVLALIAGILNFIPNFGPLLSMIPAILIALTQGVDKAIIVAVVYLLLQIIEGNVITPSIQQKLIKLPAALTIVAQLFMGILSGVWGLILATPLVAIFIVVLHETYVKKINTGNEI
jgi:predicted PurR-regulated permease PerM